MASRKASYELKNGFGGLETNPDSHGWIMQHLLMLKHS